MAAFARLVSAAPRAESFIYLDQWWARLQPQQQVYTFLIVQSELQRRT